uniref:hypothetical protein n=1 Tax=Fulvivirga sp. TaxID=1931237 RepID=UPI00404AB418
MKNIYIKIFLVLTIGTQSCDFIDPREADPNPNLTQENILSTGSATEPWINGLERQLAIVSQNYLVENEIASDNYFNTSTFFNTNLDDLFIQAGDGDFDNFLFAVSDLRESAKIGLNVIAPSDQSTTNLDRAEMFYFKGIAFMLAGEMFAMPNVEPNGAPQPYIVSLDSAVTAFNRAITLGAGADPARLASYHMVLARTYYSLGNKQAAVTNAQTVLSLDPMHLRNVVYDNTNTPTNTMADAIYDRANFDLQPLPRLDFLDPKMATIGTNETPLAFTKAEEAHLILAEAAISDGNLVAAKANFDNLIGLVSTRGTVTIPENDQRQFRGGTGVRRPNGASIQVRASASDPFMSGLVLSRVLDSTAVGATVSVTVPNISGTSVISADIAAITDLDEALEMCYLLRQHVFIAEGRRMQDLGVKWPLSQDEQLQNPNINEGDEALSGVVPSFIPGNSEMDAYSWNRTTDEVTILHNVNRILVQNKSSNLVVPFE